MATIAIIDTGYKSYEYEHTLFKKNGFTLEIYHGDPDDRTGKVNFARNAVGILVRGTVIDTAFLEQMTCLRAIVRYGVGYDNVDLAAATQKGIRVANVQGYGNHSVSDHAMMLMFACVRLLPLGKELRFANFGAPPALDLFEFHDKTLGIIGLGRIGSHFCRKARHLFNKVLAVDPYITDETFTRHGATKTDLATLLTESHVISFHCTLTDETRQLLNASTFGQMRNRPVIINTARGPIIDEIALMNALTNQQIHSAGLDVFAAEPPAAASQELLEHPRVIATGHYAWYSDKAALELQTRAADNMVKLLKGEMISDCLNPEATLMLDLPG